MPTARSVLERDAAKHAKAVEYLSAGRVRVLHVSRDHVDALVKGSAPEPYVVSRFGDRPYECNCQAARTGRAICSHIVAVALVAGPGQSAEARERDLFAAYAGAASRG